jgi:hypothetical protein
MAAIDRRNAMNTPTAVTAVTAADILIEEAEDRIPRCGWFESSRELADGLIVVESREPELVLKIYFPGVVASPKADRLPGAADQEVVEPASPYFPYERRGQFELVTRKTTRRGGQAGTAKARPARRLPDPLKCGTRRPIGRVTGLGLGAHGGARRRRRDCDNGACSRCSRGSQCRLV